MGRRKLWWLTLFVGGMAMSMAPPSPAWASRARHYYHHRHHAVVVGGPAAPAMRGALVEDADSGRVLYAYNADMAWPPASMAKMMMLLVAEDQLKAGRVHLTDPVRVSANAAATHGTRLGLHTGDVYPLGELMKAALVKSANDAAVAVAEKVGGSTAGCVAMMNQKARSLDLKSTHYNTVDGLPPSAGHDVDVTDAYDLATVARTIIHTTNLLEWSSQQECPFDNGLRMLHNTNHLIGHFDGCDGIKTGFTYHAGFNLTATARRGDLRLVAVVLGAPSNPGRFREAGRLLEWGFDNFTAVTVAKKGETLPVRVQVASSSIIQPVAAADVKVVLPKRDVSTLKIEYDIPSEFSGPLLAGSPMGIVNVRAGGRIVTRVGALSPVSVGDASQLIKGTRVVQEQGAGVQGAAAADVQNSGE
ncbi:MAG TPA: D-alanyl-D-alanine carboxypeptidase family protein [Candidatus Binataceae bacterium]|nr:D-alanyl-D-alanine carboxypeptidase family protein [Candidatus Binataceae bacterium]